MELGKEIGWIRPKNTDGGEYDDSLIKSQIKTLDEELDKIQDDMILFEDTKLPNVEFDIEVMDNE